MKRKIYQGHKLLINLTTNGSVNGSDHERKQVDQFDVHKYQKMAPAQQHGPLQNFSEEEDEKKKYDFIKS